MIKHFNKAISVFALWISCEKTLHEIINVIKKHTKYKIIIPQTEEEFEAEAKAQRNCVYTNYFPTLINGNNPNMRIVFLRKKENINVFDKVSQIFG